MKYKIHSLLPYWILLLSLFLALAFLFPKEVNLKKDYVEGKLSISNSKRGVLIEFSEYDGAEKGFKLIDTREVPTGQVVDVYGIRWTRAKGE